MEVLNQMNCVFVPFDHCHLCIKPPLLTRASGINKASHLKETCHNCSMTPQYHNGTDTKIHDGTDPPLINQSGSSCFEGYSNRLHAAASWHDGRFALQDALDCNEIQKLSGID